MAVALLCTLLSGCKSMPDEMAAAVTMFKDQVPRITAQTAEAGELLEKAQSVLSSNKPVSDVTTTSKLRVRWTPSKRRSSSKSRNGRLP